MMEHNVTGCCSTIIHPDFSWTDWSPDIDREHIAGAGDNYHGLLDSMIQDIDLHTLPIQAWFTSVSPSSTNFPRTPADEHPPEDDDRTLRLVHLLMAAAEALDGPCKSPHLAHVILARLRQLPARGGAGSTERLAVHFTNALLGLLDGGGAKEPPNHTSEALVAFQLLQDMSPCMKFGHFTANQAILEAVAGERRVHIVDYDIMEGVQWASLMQALMSIGRGFARPHLRITAVTLNRRSAKESGRRLAAFAASIGLSFSFGLCQLDGDEKFRPAAVRVVKGEAVVLNCVLHPCSADGARSFLAGAAALRARLVTLVDLEREQIGFVGSFMEEMKRYSAMCDALEAGFPKQGRARETVERVVLASMIAGAVGRAYRRVEGRWGECLEAAEFGKVGLSFFNLCQARLLLSLFNDGYHVEEDGRNKIVLCWKSCRLISASVWSAPPEESPEGNYFSC
ncbi:Nodulation-signaling pathway 2 protein [Platanthera zijinensis]|uniref:Nodulation-signaling pathway 2 protein n=1 Tax=Platanthera zijinensis TaxID=2320716 RepID=A0AAP0BWJ2_9ASPA